MKSRTRPTTGYGAIRPSTNSAAGTATPRNRAGSSARRSCSIRSNTHHRRRRHARTVRQFRNRSQHRRQRAHFPDIRRTDSGSDAGLDGRAPAGRPAGRRAAQPILYVPVAGLAIGGLVIGLIGRRRLKLSPEATALCLTILLALAANAAICGIFSHPVDRYQSRLVLLAPFAMAALFAQRWRSPVKA